MVTDAGFDEQQLRRLIFLQGTLILCVTIHSVLDHLLTQSQIEGRKEAEDGDICLLSVNKHHL